VGHSNPAVLKAV